jgi:hypothetical protein
MKWFLLAVAAALLTGAAPPPSTASGPARDARDQQCAARCSQERAQCIAFCYQNGVCINQCLIAHRSCLAGCD